MVSSRVVGSSLFPFGCEEGGGAPFRSVNVGSSELGPSLGRVSAQVASLATSFHLAPLAGTQTFVLSPFKLPRMFLKASSLAQANDQLSREHHSCRVPG